MEAPAAYQKGPEIPNFHATVEDCKIVAAQVHCETITAAIRPERTDLPAELKDSDVLFFFPVAYRWRLKHDVVLTVKNNPTPKDNRTDNKANWNVHLATTFKGPLILWLENSFL